MKPGPKPGNASRALFQQQRVKPPNPSGATLTEQREGLRDRQRDLDNLARMQAQRPLKPPGRRV